jgi:UDP-N-acetylmuramate--alanine ligase
MIPINILFNTKKIHFVGIGGIGMSGLAEYYLKTGYRVSGSDSIASAVTKRLKELGAEINIGHSAENINGTISLVVYTSAVKEDNPELIKAKELNIRMLKRAEVLGAIVNDKFLIAVAGTHGKTTTTAMISKVLSDMGLDPLVFVGGSVRLFDGGASRFGSGKYAVVEADEYDRSFLSLKPDIAVITNIDEDHLDIYGDLNNIKDAFRQFCINSKHGAKIIYCGDDGNIKDMVVSISREKFSYGYGEDNYYKIKDNTFDTGKVFYNIQNSKAVYQDISLKLIGKHNILNSAACFAVCSVLNLDFGKFKDSLKGFETVDRRLQMKYQNKITVFDDYAHHPVEIQSSIKALKESYSTSRVITVFQPHLYSRTRDFYRQFARSLALADFVVLLDIYPARELPIEGISSRLIYDEINKQGKKCEYITNNSTLKDFLINIIRDNDIVVFQGAGDVTGLCDEFISELKSITN